MTPDDPRHGTSAGYLAETKAGIPHCQPCRDARAKYQRHRDYDQKLGRPRTVPAIGARRRVRALQRLGWSLSMIAADAGWNSPEALQYVMRSESITRRSSERIATTYERLSMTLPPYNSATARARNRAERLGYPPPLAWDNIDDPNEKPEARDVWREDLVDHALIERVLSGEKRPRKLTSAEAAEIVRRALSRGHTPREIAQLYGLKVERYYRQGDAA